MRSDHCRLAATARAAARGGSVPAAARQGKVERSIAVALRRPIPPCVASPPLPPVVKRGGAGRRGDGVGERAIHDGDQFRGSYRVRAQRRTTVRAFSTAAGAAPAAVRRSVIVASGGGGYPDRQSCGWLSRLWPDRATASSLKLLCLDMDTTSNW
jgi:hypothetical protein